MVWLSSSVNNEIFNKVLKRSFEKFFHKNTGKSFVIDRQNIFNGTQLGMNMKKQAPDFLPTEFINS